MKSEAKMTEEQRVRRSTFERKRANGDIYVYEREYVYDKTSGNTKNLRTRLIGKRAGGTGELTATRAKRGAVKKSGEESAKAPAFHGRLCDRILADVGVMSGVERALAAVFDSATAKEALTLTRFLTMTEDFSLARLTAWQMTHAVPVVTGLTPEDVQVLLEKLGHEEGARQHFFSHLSHESNPQALFAFDTATLPVRHVESFIPGSYAAADETDGRAALPLLRVLTFYDGKAGRFLGYTRCLNDTTAPALYKKLITRADFLEDASPVIVTQYIAQAAEKVTALVKAYMHFLVQVPLNSPLVSEIFERAVGRFASASVPLPQDAAQRVMTVAERMRFTFKRQRQRAGNAADQTVERTVWFHFIRDTETAASETASLESYLADLKARIEADEAVTDERDRKNADYFFDVVKVPGRRSAAGGPLIHAELNGIAFERAKARLGFTVLVTNTVREGEEAWYLTALRRFVRSRMQEASSGLVCDDARLAWRAAYLKGALFTRFLSLAYIGVMRFAIRRMIREGLAGEKGGDLVQSGEWLTGKTAVELLAWFDRTENEAVSTPFGRKNTDFSSVNRTLRILDYFRREALKLSA